MLTFDKFSYFLSQNGIKIKALLLLIAFFCVISPYTGLLNLQSNLVIYFNSNAMNIHKFPRNLNPIFFMLESSMYELNLLLEFFFPKLWGSENYNFLRFLFKLPLLFFYILDAFLIEKIIAKEWSSERLASKAFLIQLFNIPLIFMTFFLGTWESIAIFFLLLNYLILIHRKKEIKGKNASTLEALFAGFFLGIAVSFSYFLILVILLFIPLLKIKSMFVYCISTLFSLILIYIPVANFGYQQINFIPNQFGIGVLLTFFHLEYLFFYIFVLEMILLVVISQSKFLTFFDKLPIFSALIIFFSINFTFSDFIIFFQIFLLGMLRFSDFSFNSKVNYTIPDQSSTNTKIFLLNYIFYFIFLIYFAFIYQISNVFYLRIIIASPLNILNILFWNTGLIIEFKSIFFIIFAIQLFLATLLMIQKRKIFNINQNDYQQDLITS